MELRHLRSFVTLADDLHFGRAASRIPLAQSALSHHIKQLEREVGARLFERGAGFVRLTPAGESFLPHARATLRHAELAVSTVREQLSGIGGHLRVGVFANGAAEITVPLLREFLAGRPNVRLSLVELDVTQQASELLEHRVDAALVRPPLPQDGVRVVPLAMEPRVAVVPEGHPLAADSMIMVEDVLEEPVLTPHPREPRVWTDYWRMTDRRGGRPPREVGPGDARSVSEWLHALAVRGAVSTAGASMARYYPFGGVRYVPIVDVGACELAVAVRAGEDEALPQAFVAEARRAARRHAGLLTTGRAQNTGGA